MKKLNYTLLLSGIIASIALTSCNHDLYDEEEYLDMLESYFPVDSIANGHDWATVTSAEVNVTLNKTEGKAYTIYVCDGDPTTESEVTVFLNTVAKGGTTLKTSVSFPDLLDNLYIICDSAGYVVNKEIVRNTWRLKTTFDESLASPEQNSASKEDFSWRFLFEDTFPAPSGSYDFNDCVITVSKLLNAADPTTVYLYVTLDAIGSVNSMAAVMHISGLTPDNVKSIYAEQPFDFYNYSSFSEKIYDAPLGYVETSSGEVAIPLFSDAHFALTGSLNNGSPIQRYINTVGSSSPSAYSGVSLECASKTAVYVLRLSSEEAAQTVTANNMDLFLVTEENGTIYETHCFPFKKNMMLYTFVGGIAASGFLGNSYPWALLVPGDFEYPQEGIAIGSTKSRYLGAYITEGHSFAEWAQHSYNATDWYLYPSNEYIYNQE